jgi:hypothetical protein
VERLSCFVPDPLAAGDGPEARSLVLTGAAAAARIGLPVLTAVQRPLYRVNAEAHELDAIPQALGGFRTEQGANLTLIADRGRLALMEAREGEGGLLVAPTSRVLLDLYLEPRGEAAVDTFLDLWGDTEI